MTVQWHMENKIKMAQYCSAGPENHDLQADELSSALSDHEPRRPIYQEGKMWPSSKILCIYRISAKLPALCYWLALLPQPQYRGITSYVALGIWPLDSARLCSWA